MLKNTGSLKVLYCPFEHDFFDLADGAGGVEVLAHDVMSRFEVLIERGGER